MTLLYVVCGVLAYLFVGHLIAKKWYVPEAERIAAENAQDQEFPQNSKSSLSEEWNGKMTSAHLVMTIGWPFLGPFEAVLNRPFLQLIL